MGIQSSVIFSSLGTSFTTGIFVSVSAFFASELFVSGFRRYVVFPGSCGARVRFGEPGFFYKKHTIGSL